MKIEIKKIQTLSNKDINDIVNLYNFCNEYDYTKYVFDEEDDFKQENDINTFLLYENQKLISSLNIFAPTKNEAEIIALTKPSKRKNGYFNLLLECAKKEIERRDIKSILFVCDSKSENGNNAIKHLNANYEYSEFLMEYRIKENTNLREVNDINISIAQIAEKDKLVEINHLAFHSNENESKENINKFFTSERRKLYSIKLKNEVIGMIGIYDESSRKYIYGFCIDSNYQKRGIGKYVLNEIVKNNQNDNKKIVLEVQADNRNALKVYEEVGFFIEAEFKYYRCITT